MSYLQQLSEWQKNKTLLRIITVEKGKGHQIHVGNIIFADTQTGNFLFYDLDNKSNHNFTINEVEDIQPYVNKKQEGTIVKPKIAKINHEEFKADVRLEAMKLIRQLPEKELYAIVPVLQLLAAKNCDIK